MEEEIREGVDEFLEREPDYVNTLRTAVKDVRKGKITINQARARFGLNPIIDDSDMPYLYESEAKKERPAKHPHRWLNAEIEVSKQTATAFVATCLAIGLIAGWIICKLLP